MPCWLPGNQELPPAFVGILSVEIGEKFGQSIDDRIGDVDIHLAAQIDAGDDFLAGLTVTIDIGVVIAQCGDSIVIRVGEANRVIAAHGTGAQNEAIVLCDRASARQEHEQLVRPSNGIGRIQRVVRFQREIDRRIRHGRCDRALD